MKRPQTAAQRAWCSSARFREICRQSALRNLALFAARPRCSAKRKNGDPCRGMALEPTGKCRVHGGRTPRQNEYHVPQWPTDGPGAWAKAQRKIKDRERRARLKAEKLAAMSQDQIDAHRRWQQAHRPGSAATRTANRLRGAQDREARAHVNDAPPRQPSSEVQSLGAQIEALKRKLHTDDSDENERDLGVFG